jgi:xylulokinase
VSDTELFVGHDLGTGGDKAVLVDLQGRVLATAFEPYELHHPAPHIAEQDPEDYWRAVGITTRAVLAQAGARPEDVAAIGFAGQMLTLVPLDARGVPTRTAISWMDSRADAEARRLVRRLGGPRVVRAVAGAVPSGKDIVCKLTWLKKREPEVFARTAAFCDATGYLVARATGELIADHTAAGGTGLLNRKTREWDRVLTTLIQAPVAKLPAIRACADIIGGLRPDAAADLALPAGTPVVAGLGDVPAAQVGAGALEPGDAHICLGTSGWLCVTTTEPKDLGRNGIFALPAADPTSFAMVGEMETAGECLDWFADHLCEPGTTVADLLAEAEAVPPGAGGVVFLPWMFGERAPITDTTLRGGFVNLSLEHRRGHLVRAILEGVALNLRWVLEVVEKAGHPCPTLRAIGGGSRSDLWLQIVADATGRRVEAVTNAQSAGAVGAALTAAVGLGRLPDYAAVKPLVATDRTFTPDASRAALYDLHYGAFRCAHPALTRVGRLLNR